MVKKLIRQNCFETNSSSTHSLVISTKNKKDVPDVVDADGILELCFDPGELSPFLEKLKFIMTLYIERHRFKPELFLDPLYTVLKKEYPNFQRIKISFLDIEGLRDDPFWIFRFEQLNMVKDSVTLSDENDDDIEGDNVIEYLFLQRPDYLHAFLFNAESKMDSVWN